MSQLFNGVLESKLKTKLPDQTAALKAIARNGKKDNKTYDITVDEAKVPLPSVLLKHEIDKDEQLQCDKDGF